jgi:uncharacterized protein involved in outer membrane biogenesis
MQTTLLGVAIVIILALVAALVGPLFIDWSRHRSEFEAQAAWVTGLEFRINGRIDARLLPTPTLTLHDIEVGRPGGGSPVRVRALHVEYELGALVRGEWRMSEASLDGPEFEVGLDATGGALWPLPASGFAPREVSIQRLSIKDGRATLVHHASGSRLLLDKIDFAGSLGSLAGPVKGEGVFAAAGQQYPYRIGMSRVADDGSVKVRLNVDRIEQPLTTDANISVRVERGAPQFDGTIAFARPVARAGDGGIIEPWRVSSRIKGDSSAAVLEQIELQYGPDDRATKLRGDARLTFGSKPQLDGTFASPQLDLDRMLSLPEETRRRPLVAVKTLVDYVSGSQRLPFPVKLGFSVESLTLAGSMLQRVSGGFKADSDAWDIENLDLRAPGITQIRLSGRFDATPKGVAFRGPAKIDTGDARAFFAWLADRADIQAIAPGSLRLGGDITLGSETIAIDRLDAEIDRMTVAGSFAYSRTSNDRPARLDVALTAPEVNIDRVQALAKAILGDADFDRPRQGDLSFKIGRASIGGVEAKQADIKMRIDADGLAIDRLAIADLSGAALAVKGHIDTRTQSPRGAVTLELDARSLDGVTALVEKLAPRAAEKLRRLGGRATPVALRGSLTVEPTTGNGGGANAIARYKIDGRAGTLQVALQGDSGVAGDALKGGNLAALAAGEVNLAGRLDADDGGDLVDLVGLERLIAVDRRPGRLTIASKGPLDGELAIDSKLTTGALELSTNGTVNASDQENPTAALKIKFANANLKSPRPAAPGGAAELLPASGTFALALEKGTLRLSDIKGTVAGATVAGRLAIETQQQPIAFDGDLELGAVDLTAAISTGIGVPTASPGGAPAGFWRDEPFQQIVHGARGQIVLKAARVALTPNLSARDFRGRLYIGDSQLAVQVMDGSVAGGRVAGELIFLRESAGLIARLRASLSGADVAQLLAGNDALTGLVALEVTAEGTGMSPSALIGALEGNGKITLTNGRLARLDPTAFDTVIGAVDRGLPVDAARVGSRMDQALAGGPLTFRRAEAGIRIEGGQARMMSNPMLTVPDVDLAVSGLVNLLEGAVDWRLTLSAMPRAGAPMGTSMNTWPEIVMSLRGPVNAVRRTIDVAAFTSWLAVRAIDQQSKKLDALEGREPAAPMPGR